MHKAYDDGRLVSSKYLTPFSDLRLPASAPSHQPIADYVAYLEAYAAKFDLLPLVAFEHEVLRVERLASGAVMPSSQVRVRRAVCCAACCGDAHPCAVCCGDSSPVLWGCSPAPLRILNILCMCLLPPFSPGANPQSAVV